MTKTQELILGILPVATPVVVAWIKLVAPKIPGHWIPWLCPLLGAAAVAIPTYLQSGGVDANTFYGALMGALGLWVREALDQWRKRNDGNGDVEPKLPTLADTVKKVAPLLLCIPLLVGCGTLRGDPVVIRAEQAVVIARDTFDLFLKLEHQNCERLKQVDPAIHQTAERFRADKNANGRADALDWLDSANKLKLAYKASKVESNRTALLSALAVVESALSEAQKNLAKGQ